MTMLNSMKTIVFIFLLCVAICNIWSLYTSTLLPTMSVSPSSPSAACNSFSMSLFKQLVEMNNKNTSGNIFYSPLSICSALATVLLGARGDTATQMSQVLHFNGHNDHLELSKLLRDLDHTPAGGEPHHTLSLARRMYGEQSYKFTEEFLSEAGKLYNTGLEPVDFVHDAEGARQNVNGWVEKQTQGKIKELLASGVVDPLTRLVVVNGLYFKGKWDKQFSEAHTTDVQFRLSKTESRMVKMMYQTAEFPLGFIPEVDCQVLELPYAGGDLSMLVFLPVETEGNTSTGLERLEEELTYERFVEWTKPGTMHQGEVQVGLPHFKMAETYDLKDVLIGMGMVDAFDHQGRHADFSGMSPNNDLVLSQVVHKACVEVNEEGSEAAASTAAVMTMRSVFPQSFVADHPFLFFIRHKPTMSILFAGRYCSPP